MAAVSPPFRTALAPVLPGKPARLTACSLCCAASSLLPMPDSRLPNAEGEPAAASERRAAVRLLREASAATGLRLETFCGDWVARLRAPDGRTRLVWGYHFDLNPSAGALVAKDKAATFEVLRAAGIRAVEHRLFLRADLEGYVSEAGSWAS